MVASVNTKTWRDVSIETRPSHTAAPLVCYCWSGNHYRAYVAVSIYCRLFFTERQQLRPRRIHGLSHFSSRSSTARSRSEHNLNSPKATAED
jgi:hypothetical protein